MKRLGQFNLNLILTNKGFTNNSNVIGETNTTWSNSNGITIQRYDAPEGVAVAIYDTEGNEVGRYYVSQNGDRNQPGIDEFLNVLEQYL